MKARFIIKQLFIFYYYYRLINNKFEIFKILTEKFEMLNILKEKFEMLNILKEKFEMLNTKLRIKMQLYTETLPCPVVKLGSL